MVVKGTDSHKHRNYDRNTSCVIDGRPDIPREDSHHDRRTVPTWHAKRPDFSPRLKHFCGPHCASTTGCTKKPSFIDVYPAMGETTQSAFGLPTSQNWFELGRTFCRAPNTNPCLESSKSSKTGENDRRVIEGIITAFYPGSRNNM